MKCIIYVYLNKVYLREFIGVGLRVPINVKIKSFKSTIYQLRNSTNYCKRIMVDLEFLFIYLEKLMMKKKKKTRNSWNFFLRNSWI